jgi:hypothetical protein
MPQPLQQSPIKRDLCLDSEDHHGHVLCQPVKKQQANIPRRLDSGPVSQRVGHRHPEEFALFQSLQGALQR